MIAAARNLMLAALVLWTRLALACPYCIGSQKSTNTLKAVGVFMLFPFGVAATIFWAVRKIERSDKDR